MAYKRKTLDKKAPATSGKLLVETDRYLLFWRYRTKRPPRPKRWAPLCLFVHGARKRSYYVTWNGRRFADSEYLRVLTERHPDIVDELPGRLGQFNHRLIKETDEDPYE